MILEPRDLLENLEFDKVTELLQKECYGTLGREAARLMGFETELELIQRKLTEVEEFKRSIAENDKFPIHTYENVSKDLRMLEVEGFVLPVESLQRLNVQLLLVRDIFKFFNSDRKQTYPVLYDIIRPIQFDEDLSKAIEQVIDENGEIRPDASPELAKIRKGIISKQREMEKVFRSMIQNYRSKGWLTDNVESFRNGRRVLSVPAEHKRKIRGIIHDESSSGKTAFIEPEAVIDINNDIFDLYNEEKREIYRILKELSAQLRPYVPVLRQYQSCIVRFDLIQAKARIAVRMGAVKPRMVDGPHLGIQMGFHPLLLLKNRELDRETIPFDLSLFGPNRILVLSGPNAGGKSVTMKAVGLLQLMVQSGMLVPMDEISEIGIFKKVFADIGDQQSLEDDLSTYSSRLRNMKVLLDQADEESLLLIDEFGSGTDPKIGGAIAEAILEQLNQIGPYGVITTHYSNLKVFAFKTKGLVNGSMLFDKDQLAPTYQLKVGRPGSSYAFEIAHKSGLSPDIINYAKKRTGKNEKAVDQLLVDLQREKQELEEKLTIVTDREQQLEKLIKNYENLHRDLEYKRKKIKLTAKEQALQHSAQENRRLEKLVREIKETKDLEKAKALAKETRTSREQMTEEVSELREDLYVKSLPIKKKERPIQVGDYVRMRSGGATGQVEDIKKSKAIVQMGIMRLEVNVRDLEHAKAPLDVQASKSVQMDTVDKSAKFESKIDIRGMRLQEALQVVEEFVDQALITSVRNLEIVHGKGNGILRNAVKNKLREYDAILNIRHPEQQSGGDGVTLVELE